MDDIFKQSKDYTDDAIKEAMRFPTAKYGDTPTDDQQLTPKKYVDGQISSVYSSVIAGLPSVAVVVPAVFGDGSDGTVTLNGSTNYPFASITSSNTYTQTRDIYAVIYNINDGVTLKPNQWRNFASSVFHGFKASIYAVGPTGSINAGIPAGYFPSIAAGGGQASGGNSIPNQQGQVGADGRHGPNVTHSFGVSGVDTRSLTNPVSILGGAAGPFQGGSGGNKGIGGTATGYITRPVPIWGTQYFLDVNDDGTLSKMTASGGAAGGPGGGSGASGGTTQLGGTGGDGGAGGTNGGIVYINAKAIILDPGFIIDVRGGIAQDGHNGFTPSVTSAQQGGGGAAGNGGSGGDGGYAILVGNTVQQNGSILTAGGNQGAGGFGASGVNGGGTGNDGAAGFNGNAGSVMTFIITN